MASEGSFRCCRLADVARRWSLVSSHIQHHFIIALFAHIFPPAIWWESLPLFGVRGRDCDTLASQTLKHLFGTWLPSFALSTHTRISPQLPDSRAPSCITRGSSQFHLLSTLGPTTARMTTNLDWARVRRLRCRIPCKTRGLTLKTKTKTLFCRPKMVPARPGRTTATTGRFYREERIPPPGDMSALCRCQMRRRAGCSPTKPSLRKRLLLRRVLVLFR